ncbi:hypothetical protein AAFF_G00307680 [Aldrovandia affinis]|uniref:Gasdermin pore forming domain-containing protein n=1 Tax=Aldrovandia affinis TaxID=143900 RepID=A0AAD7RAF0_9TELE|nr:hypothetical protein AAFF_G00307680 [Aldrovandia affinis]
MGRVQKRIPDAVGSEGCVTARDPRSRAQRRDDLRPAAMLARATGNFVRHIDPEGRLIPLTRLNDSDKLLPLALVIKRSRFWLWQRNKYRPSVFTLNDLLLGDTPLRPDVMESDFLKYEGTFEDTVSGRLAGEAGPMTLTLEGRSSSRLQSSFGRLRKQEVDIQKLLQASKDRVLDLEHRLLRQTRQRCRVVLAVLTERIVSTQPCSICQQVQGLAGCGGLLALIGPTDIQVSVEEKGRLKSDSSVSLEIPEFTVIAYSVIELEINHSSGQYDSVVSSGSESDAIAEGPGLGSRDREGSVSGLDGLVLPGGFEVDGPVDRAPKMGILYLEGCHSASYRKTVCCWRV